MTIEARKFFGFIPLGKTKVPVGDEKIYSVTEVQGSTKTSVGIVLEVLSLDKIDDLRDISAVNRELGRQKEGTPNLLHFTWEKDKINRGIPPIPSRIRGVRTELRWRESTLAERMAEAFWDLAEAGKIGVQLELLQVTQNYEGLETTVRLSEEFKKLLDESGVMNPRLSVHDGRQIEAKVAEDFLKDLDVSPKGLFGGWKTDEMTWMTKDGHFRINRTTLPTPTNSWNPPVIVYTSKIDITAD